MLLTRLYVVPPSPHYEIQLLVDRKIPVVVPAGNDGGAACKSFPGNIAGAITVGATDQNDKQAPFSNGGACVDLWAPGVDMYSVWHYTPLHTVSYSSTTSAAALVAGALAILLETFPRMSAPVAEHIIKRVASPSAQTLGADTTTRLLYVGPVLTRRLIKPTTDRVVLAEVLTAATFTVALHERPEAPVTVKVICSAPERASVSVSELTFTPDK